MNTAQSPASVRPIGGAQARAARDNRALELLRGGSSFSQAADATGMPVDRLRQLVAEQPRPGRPAAACPHVVELTVRELEAHPGNVRTDLGNLDEMVASIRAQGVLQPLLVRRILAGRYRVIGGHRRLAAARLAGLTRVPVMVTSRVADEIRDVEAMLVENLQRADLHPLDEAKAYRTLIAAGSTAASVAQAVGKNAGHISQRLALLNLTPGEQDALRRKEISIDAGYKAGRDRSEGRRAHDTKRPKPKVVPHFTARHPLAAAAKRACDHETTLKLGVACGPCWERAIRDDVLALLNTDHLERTA